MTTASALALLDRIRPNTAVSDCAQAARIIRRRLRGKEKIEAAIERAAAHIRSGSAVSLAVHRALIARSQR